MDRFIYREGELYCEDVPVRRIAEAVGTPTYVYSAATLLDHYDRTAAAFAELRPSICFSVKSCSNIHILKLLVDHDAGIDIVSGGELFRALQAGVDPQRIVFAGVGKTDPEIQQAIDAGIGWFNVESEAELANLIDIAGRADRTVRAALRLNPDVDAKTHRYTTTGKRETKFGVDLERAVRVFREFGRDPRVRLTGIHLHLGSPTNSVEPYVQALSKACQLITELRGEGFTIDTLNLGGGFAAHYKDQDALPASEYARHIVPMLRGQGLQIMLEPGRSIAANAGILLTRATYIKRGGEKVFVIVDGSMSDLIRPALYNAWHFIWPTQPGPALVPPCRSPEVDLPGSVRADVVGPLCETADFLGQGRQLPPVKRGDLLAVFTAGAYGFTMASHYNSRPNAAEVLVEGGALRVIRRRETYEDLVRAERV